MIFRICEYPQMKKYLFATFTLVMLWFLPATLYAKNDAPSKPTFESADYSRGFDPLERDRGIWWTSVCQTSAPTEGSINLNVNDHVTANFPSGTEQDYSILVLNESGTDDNDMLTLGFFDPSDPSKTPRNPGQPLLQITGLKITGKPHTRSDFATIYICPKQDPQTRASAVAKLYVYVLAKRTLSLGIWRVKSHPDGNTDIPADYTAAVIWNAYLYARKAYRQACIEFTSIQNPADVTAYYDVAPSNNNAFDRDIAVELNILDSGLPANAAKANVSIVKQFFLGGGDDSATGGATLMASNSSQINSMALTGALGFQPNEFDRTCAHEIGHQLNLCLRDPNPNPQPPLLPESFLYHDTGPFPANIYGMLYPSVSANGVLVSVWLRHQDWVSANINASLK